MMLKKHLATLLNVKNIPPKKGEIKNEQTE